MSEPDQTTGDRLTPEQQALWVELALGPATQTPGETPEMALNRHVAEFQYVCTLEGLPEPSREAVLAALDEE